MANKKKCESPFKQKRHRNQKTYALNADVRHTAQQLYPNFDWSNIHNICTLCRLKIAREVHHISVGAAAQSIITNISTRLGVVPPRLYPSLPTDILHIPSPSAPPKELLDECQNKSEEQDSTMDQSEVSANVRTHRSIPTGTGVERATSSSDEVSSLQPSTVSSTIPNITPRTKGLVELNRSLMALQQTPVSKTDTHKPSNIRKKLRKSIVSLKEKFGVASAKPVNLSPDKEHSCRFCDELFNKLCEKFRMSSDALEKYKIGTSIPTRFTAGDIKEALPCTTYFADKIVRLRNLTGPFSTPARVSSGHPISQEVIQRVREFYLMDDNSRAMPGLRDTVMVNGERVAKRQMLVNLKDLFALFHEANPEMKIQRSKFASLRPRNCTWPGIHGFHNTCTCQIHENFKLMFSAFNTTMKFDNFVKDVTCVPATNLCATGLCNNCPNMEILERLKSTISDDEEVEYYKWCRTDRTDLEKVSCDVESFVTNFENALPAFIEHNYVMRKQKEYIKNLHHSLHEDSAVIIQADFSQNYSFVIQDAVQGYHWTHQQATVHPFAVSWWNQDTNEASLKHYCVISDELSHDANTFHVFRTKVLAQVTEDLDSMNISEIHYISDGAGSQYKNIKIFANLMEHQADFGIPAQWHFTATSHGKSSCDAIGAVVKRSTRLESLKAGVYIRTPMEMYNFCVRKLKTNKLDFLFCSKEEVSAARVALSERYVKYNSIPGTRKFHSFKPLSDSHIEARVVSSSIQIFRYNIKGLFECFIKKEDLREGSFYMFVENNSMQLGMLVDIQHDKDEIEMQAMKITRSNFNLRWPSPSVTRTVPIMDLLILCDDPVAHPRNIFKLNDGDVENAKKKFLEYKVLRR